jgi:hypothetical protein
LAATRPGPAQAAARAAAATPDPWFCTCCGGQNPGPAARCDGCGTVAAVRAAQPAGGDHGGGPGSARLALLAAPLLLLAVVIGGSLVAERTERRGRYLAAEAALAAGQYADADAAFASAAGYRDAVARRAALAAARAPVAAARADAVAALAAGRYEAAIAALLPVARRFPGDGDVAPLLAEARALHRDDLAREASAAEARRDWLAAERALAALVAADPAAPEPAARLGAVRREHAPLVVARDRALWLVDPASAEARLLTDAVPAARPVWSPDRTKVAFISAPDEGGRAAAALYVIAADGSGLRQLSASVHPSALPAWSPEGGRIAYTSVATGTCGGATAGSPSTSSTSAAGATGTRRRPLARPAARRRARSGVDAAAAAAAGPAPWRPGAAAVATRCRRGGHRTAAWR